jgi:hypothetical protein
VVKMNNPQGPSRYEIYQRLDAKSTEELLEIWRSGSQSGWRGTAYDIVREILQKRQGQASTRALASIPYKNPAKTPWMLILGGLVVVLILAVVVFSPGFKPGSPASPEAGLPASPSQIATTNLTTAALPTDTSYPTVFPTATPIPPAAATLSTNISRPVTAVIMPNASATGYGELTIENGTANDGVVILTLNDVPITAAYIRTMESFKLRGIRDGTYFLYFSTGEGWNGKVFTLSPSHKKFEDSFPFTTGTTTYTTWSVTLQGVVGGTAAADDVNPSAFPSIQ